MEHIGDFIKDKTFKGFKPLTKQQWINKFFYNLEPSWNSFNSKPLERYIVARALKKFPEWEIPVLWKLCETSSNFSSFFWWKVKNQPKREVKKTKKIANKKFNF